MKPEWLVEISAWKFQTFQNLKSTLRRRGPGLTGTLSIDDEWGRQQPTGSDQGELNATTHARLVVHMLSRT